MGLNDFRDEAGSFLKSIGAEDEDVKNMLRMIDEELTILKASVNERDILLFLLFELASKYELDLDEEWEKGRERKKKYIDGRK